MTIRAIRMALGIVMAGAAMLTVGGNENVCAERIGKAPSASAKQKPLFRDFMGLCVHTVMFKPDLYKPICRLVRDYHGFEWDVGDDSSYAPKFPLARNGVD